MMLSKMNKFAAAMACAVAFVGKAHAQEAPWLNMSADINLDASGSKSKDYEKTLRTETVLRFEVLMHEGVKAVIKARIQDELMKDGVKGVNNSQNIDKFLEEAYISIETDKISGLPRAVITAGKGEMAFGQGYSEIPVPRDSQLYNLAREREVMGVTVTLPANFLKIADQIAVSLYETGAGDLKISDSTGVAVKANKKLSAQIEAQVSALIKENEGVSNKEKRGSMGVIYTDASGKYKVWVEGLVFDHNPSMTETRNYGGQVGGSYKVGPGSIVVEYSQVKNAGKETTLAYNWPVAKSMVLSPMIKHTKNEVSNASDTVYGLRASFHLAQQMTRPLLKSR